MSTRRQRLDRLAEIAYYELAELAGLEGTKAYQKARTKALRAELSAQTPPWWKRRTARDKQALAARKHRIRLSRLTRFDDATYMAAHRRVIDLTT